MRKIVFSSTDSFARLASSTRITANTIDASPRGPNQPRNATVGRLAPDPSIARANGNHAHHRQAEKRIQDDLGGEIVEHRHEHDGAEEDEGDRAEQAARLLEEEGHLAPDLAAHRAEHGTSDEGCDEPAAVHPHRQPVGECGPGDRHDLGPDRIDQAAREAYPDHGGGCESRHHATDAPVADLLEQKTERLATSGRALLRFGNRDRDQEQRHADAVVEPALDVEPLTDT